MISFRYLFPQGGLGEPPQGVSFRLFRAGRRTCRARFARAACVLARVSLDLGCLWPCQAEGAPLGSSSSRPMAMPLPVFAVFGRFRAISVCSTLFYFMLVPLLGGVWGGSAQCLYLI